MRVRSINAVKLVEASDLVAILDEGSAIWTEMTTIGYIGSIWRGGHCQESPWSSSGADRRWRYSVHPI
eukprot:scaffold6016_cov44-Attheya_sp.AAC.1